MTLAKDWKQKVGIFAYILYIVPGFLLGQIHPLFFVPIGLLPILFILGLMIWMTFFLDTSNWD